MKHLRKWLALLLTLTMMLAGTAMAETAAAPDEIVMVYFTGATLPDIQLVEDAMNAITMEKLNVKLTLMPISAANFQQQVTLMLSGSEKVDLLLTSEMFGLSSQISSGQLMDMGELLANGGQNIVDAVGQDVIDACRIGGVVYGVPPTKETGVQYGIVMRQDLVDKYAIDLEAIHSWEDFGAVLETIHQNEPDLYPLTQYSSGYTLVDYMVNSVFDNTTDRYGVVRLDDKEGKPTLINLYETDEYRADVALVRDWYQKGYIFPDIATTQETGQSLMKAGKAFAYFGNMKPGYTEQEERATGVDLVSVNISEPITTTFDVNAMLMSIPTNCTNPEKAMELLNLLYADVDLMNLLCNGIEGTHYVVNADGKAALPEGVTESGYVFNRWELGNNFLAYTWDSDIDNLWEVTRAFNESTVKSPIFGVSFSYDAVQTQIATLSNVVAQYRSALENGTIDPSVVDEYAAALNAAGLADVMAEKQQQIDAWYAIDHAE